MVEPIEVFDIAVVGGGPAGLAAALGGARMGRRTIAFDNGVPRTAHAPDYRNVLGFPDGISGNELLRRGRLQVARHGTTLVESEVIEIEQVDAGPSFRLTTVAGSYQARSVVLATGIRDLQPKCGNLYAGTFCGIHYCVVCDGFEVRGHKVAVIGNDDHAHEMLSALRLFTTDLHLLLDGEPDRRSRFARKLADSWSVEVIPEPTVACSLRDDGTLIALASGREAWFADVFIALGVQPHTALAARLGCRLNAEGYVVTGSDGATSVRWVYAAGDCNGGRKQVTQAVAEGEQAAIEISRALRDRDCAG